MVKKHSSTDAIFYGVDLIELVKRVLNDRATPEDHRLFASFCGRGLRNWQDLLAIYRKGSLMKK
jgi:hypothetical protein